MKIQHKQSGLIVNRIKKLIYNSTFLYPMVIKGGKGCFLEDIDGKKIFRFCFEHWFMSLGYAHPELMNILKKYLSNRAHKIAGQDFIVRNI